MHFSLPHPKRFLSCEQGLAYLEFALSLSLLLILFVGSVEVTNYVLVIQKLEKTVSTVTDVTTEANPNNDPLTTSQMSQLMSAVVDMMSPYAFGPKGIVIVTDVTQAGANNPVVNWQYCGGGTLSATSRIGTSIGGPATLPSGFTMIAGEEVVIGEVFYNYTPITTTAWSVISANTIYRTSLFMPRLGALTGFSSHC
jgi:Flp pilus assembly protein TadG